MIHHWNFQFEFSSYISDTEYNSKLNPFWYVIGSVPARLIAARHCCRAVSGAIPINRGAPWQRCIGCIADDNNAFENGIYYFVLHNVANVFSIDLWGQTIFGPFFPDLSNFLKTKFDEYVQFSNLDDDSTPHLAKEYFENLAALYNLVYLA